MAAQDDRVRDDVQRLLGAAIMQKTLIIVTLITVGMLVGLRLRGKVRVLRMSDRAMMWAVYALLFSLGITIGRNEEVIGNLGKVGLTAAAVSVAAMVGSATLGVISGLRGI